MHIFPRYRGPALLDQICNPANLLSAWRRVRANIRVADRSQSAGVDAVTLLDFEYDVHDQLAQLSDELRNGAYRAQPVRRVTIAKSGGGQRAIAVLTIRDRVAQRATQQVLQPLFDPLLLDSSFGCRPELGVGDALLRVTALIDDGLEWAVDTDIRDFFDQLDQSRLLELLRQRISESPVLDLIAQWLQSGGWRTDDLAAPVPSQWDSLLHRGQNLWREWWDQSDQSDRLPDGSDASLLPGEQSSLRLAQMLQLAQPAWMLARRAVPMLRTIPVTHVAIGGAVVSAAVFAGAALQRRRTSARFRGTPQGGALSPLLANIYLHPFDLALRRRGVQHVRYLDDMLALSTSATHARRDLAAIREELAALGLQLNEAKTTIVRTDQELDFLGHVLLPERPQRIGRLTLPDLGRRWRAQPPKRDATPQSPRRPRHKQRRRRPAATHTVRPRREVSP